MKNKKINHEFQDNEMLDEYDFTDKKGIRGKYFQAYRKGHTVRIREEDGTLSIQYFTLEEGAIMLDPDIRKYFRNSDVVNTTLRALISLLPVKHEKPKHRIGENAEN
jgi:hypothetical protein